MGRTPEQMGAVDSRAFGVFYYDPTDDTAADNGGTVVVDSAGRRFRRHYSGHVDVRWFGAVGDGVTDDTAAIQSAVDAAAGGTVRCAPNATHVITSTIHIPPGVTLNATGSTLAAASDFHMVEAASGSRVIGGTYRGSGTIDAPSDGAAAVRAVGAFDVVVSGISVSRIDLAVQLANCSHVTVDGVTVEGGPEQRNGDGVTFHGCRNVQVSRVTCRSLNKVAVYASVGADLAQNSGITVSDVTVEGRPGAPFSCAVQIRACDGASISNIVARDTVYGAVSIQQYDTDGACVIQDIVCSGIVSTNSSRYGFFVSGAALPGQTRRLTFFGVRINTSATDASAAQPGAVIDSVADVALHGLSVTGTAHNCGLQLSSCTGVSATGLRVSDSHREGVLVVGCDGVCIEGVVITGSNMAGSGYNDILVTQSLHVSVGGFVCRSPAWAPVFIDSTCAKCAMGHGVASGQQHASENRGAQ